MVRSIRGTIPRSKQLKRGAITAVDKQIAVMAKALGHPARVAILRRLLAQGGCICGAIVSELPLAQATVSQHLKVLKQAGWIVGEVDGPRVCYCPHPKAMKHWRQLVMTLDRKEPNDENE